MNDNQGDRYYPKAEVPWQNPKWDDQYFRGGRSLSTKGETRELFQHARRKVAKGDNSNTSIDAPWWVHSHWGISDVYMILVMVMFLVPSMVVFWLPLFGCLLPAVLVNRFYVGWLLPVSVSSEHNTTNNHGDACEAVPRETCGWKFHCLVQFLLTIPAMALAAMILFYSNVIMTIFGLLYLMVDSILHLRSPTKRLFQNLTVLKPYQNGPSLVWHFEDCVAAVAGSVHRQHFFEFMRSFTTMFFVNPWIKYWLSGNIFLDNLGERYITQIGRAMDDMDISDIDAQFLKAISCAKNTATNRDEIDAKTFAPHYPYPPPGRRYAIGMQFGSATTTFVHTTHFRSPETEAQEGPIASLSNSAALPIYRVLLWRNNPYHIYTGYVEANISNGLPTQPEKKLGIEHPMWLINSHNKLAADRKIALSLGAIDNFFDGFIPLLSHFIRLNVRGREVADAYLADDSRLGYEQTRDYQKMAEV